MVSIHNIKKYLRRNLTAARYTHTLNLAKLAVKLAERHNLKNIRKIEIAGLLHDCRKNSQSKNNHSILAEKTAREKFGITDREILAAVRHHTFGRRNMNDFSKIIYIADISEPSRIFGEAKRIRKLAFKNLDKAMILALATKMKYVLEEKKTLSPESVLLYNRLLKNQKTK